MKIHAPRFIALALLIFAFASLTLSQTPSSTPQVQQGCATGPFSYPFPPKTFIWKTDSEGKLVRDSKGRLIRDQIDRIVTSESRMGFTFVPQRVVVQRSDNPEDNKLQLKIFPFGRETDFEGKHLQNPEAIRSLNRPPIVPPFSQAPEFKISQLKEEKKQNLDWVGLPLETVKDTGVWYAIIHNKVDLKGKGDLKGDIRYILPVSDENLKEGLVPTKMAPPIYYYYGEKLVKQIGEDLSSIPNGTLRILKSDGDKLVLDTSGLELGEYWVTLQGTALFAGQSPDRCSKTTPPVLITIKPPPPPTPEYRPELKLKPEVNCEPFVVTATATDRDTPADKLTIKDWKISDEAGKNITSSVERETVTNPDNSQTLRIKSRLKDGNYKVEATVSDGKYETTQTTDLRVYCPIVVGMAAGTPYFGNATPDYRNGEIINNPEEWTKDTEFKDRRPASEERKPGKGKYPETEYKLFYSETGAEIPVITDTNNTDTIKRIVDVLAKYPGLNLYLLGYTDFRSTPRYSNEELAASRIENVLRELQKEIRNRGLQNEIQGFSLISKNCADKTAKELGDANLKPSDAAVKSKEYIWFDIFRWDRRVEIIYVSPQEVKLPSYAAQCEEKRVVLTK